MDVSEVRSQFPILKKKIGAYPLVYLDNASTTQKPQVVIDSVSHYYANAHSNVHRSTNFLASQTEQIIASVRNQIKESLSAESSEEIIFTAGTTASLNMVASSFGDKFLQPGDEVLMSTMEHHSNWLPWHALCKRKSALLKIIPLNKQLALDQEAFEKRLSKRTKIVVLTYVSNVLGAINPIGHMIQKAHAYGAFVVVDAAQAIGRLAIHVQALDCDFLAFSGHKMYGPTGIGVLYGKKKLLHAMIPPAQLGGGMVRHISLPDDVAYESLPYALEAGTPHLAGIVGLGRAFSFLEEIGHPTLRKHEEALLSHACRSLESIPGVNILGESLPKAGIVSLITTKAHPFDVGIHLSMRGIVVRTGKHCAIPLLNALGIDSSVRISFAVYNTKDDINRLCACLKAI